jgi:integrase
MVNSHGRGLPQPRSGHWGRRYGGAGLKKDDLDLRRLDDAKLVVRKGKRGSNGVVFVPKSLAAHIRRYLHEVRPKLKGRKDPGNLLLGRERKPLTRLSLNKRMRTLLKGAGLSEERLNELSPVHCLRHTCGVLLYRATKNLRLVQKQLRHARSTTTEVYANLLDEDWRQGVEAAFST